MMKYKGKKISRARQTELKRAKAKKEIPDIGVSRAMYEAIKKQGGFRV